MSPCIVFAYVVPFIHTPKLVTIKNSIEAPKLVNTSEEDDTLFFENKEITI